MLGGWPGVGNGGSVSTEQNQVTDFAERLRRLIDTVHPPERGPYSYREIAKAVTALGVPITSSSVYQLATGERSEPKLKHVQGFATFFGVPIDYFLDETVARRLDEQISSVAIWRDPEAQEIALRALKLGPAYRAAVSGVLEAFERQQNEPAGARKRRVRNG
jgi:transcriptional regulator with XRE-family HTH domain